MLSIAILGLGDRGMNYGTLCQKGQNAQIVAVCDLDVQRVQLAAQRFGLTQEQTFVGADALFAAGKLADVLFVCSQDQDHYGHAMAGLQLGYHIMVEKPVSPNPQHLLELQALAQSVGKQVIVCHVLRYSPFYQKIKQLLQEEAIGQLISIQHSENVAYWHYIHSYVRGHWHREEETSPFLMAKCCHDMDLLHWWTQSRYTSIYSQGGLSFYTPEHMPEGATLRCCDCPHQDSCIYDATLQYLGRQHHPTPKFPWGTYAVSNTPDTTSVVNALKTNSYGHCVFAGENNVVDHQMAEICFENGVVAQFHAHAFSNDNYRQTHFWGTHGEIWCNDLEETITLQPFGQEPQVFDFSDHNNTAYGGGHVGGDEGLVEDVIALLSGSQTAPEHLTLIQDTLESHLMVEACEQSRKGHQVIHRHL